MVNDASLEITNKPISFAHHELITILEVVT